MSDGRTTVLVAGLVLAVVGATGGYAAGRLTSGAGQASMPAAPAGLPSRQRTALTDVSAITLRGDIEREGYRCTEHQAVMDDAWSLPYLSCGRDGTLVTLTHETGGLVHSLTMRCRTPPDRPRRCEGLYLWGVRVAFGSDPAGRAEASSWVSAHLEQPGATTIGDVDVVSEIRFEGMTLAGSG